MTPQPRDPAADAPTRTLAGRRAGTVRPRPHALDPAQLRPRLVAAALFLLAGFATFLGSVALGPDTGRYPHQPALFAAALVAAAVLLLTAGVLERWATAPPPALQLATAVIVLAPTAFFLVLKRSEIEFAADRGVAVPGTTAWLLPMFTYAVFVPTTLRRAAAVLGGLVLLPLLLLVVEVATVPAVAAVYTAGGVGRVAVGLAVGWAASVYAVAVMGRLRQQVGLAGRIGPYRLVRKLGAGGMGEVYLAEHHMLKRPCAVKLIRPGRRHDPAVAARFEREVRAMARLGHWNTVEVYDYGQAADGTLYYAMEHLRGLDLPGARVAARAAAAGPGGVPAAAGVRRPGRGPRPRAGPPGRHPGQPVRGRPGRHDGRGQGARLRAGGGVRRAGPRAGSGGRAATGRHPALPGPGAGRPVVRPDPGRRPVLGRGGRLPAGHRPAAVPRHRLRAGAAERGP